MQSVVALNCSPCRPRHHDSIATCNIPKSTESTESTESSFLHQLGSYPFGTDRYTGPVSKIINSENKKLPCQSRRPPTANRLVPIPPPYPPKNSITKKPLAACMRGSSSSTPLVCGK
jgi:hypothetical protein